MSLPCRLDIFRFRRTKKGLLAITNKSFLYQAFTVKMHNLLNGHFPILVYGVIACCQRHGISKRRVHSQYTKGSPITWGGKRKKLLTSVLTVFLRSCAYTCVSSYLIDGRQGKLTVFLGSYCLSYIWDSFIAVVGVFV